MAQSWPLVVATAADRIGAESGVAVAKATHSAWRKQYGESFDDGEAALRAWLVADLGGSASLAERLLAASKPVAKAKGPGARLVQRLAKLRSRAGGDIERRTNGVTLDAELSRRCTAQARRLASNPKLAAAWPAVRGANASDKAFSLAAAWADLQATGSKLDDKSDPLDAWLASVPQRLALLDPGSRAIGYGQADGFAVVDTRSLSAAPNGDWMIVWPYGGMRNVPTRARLEASAAETDTPPLGYPITLQVGPKTHLLGTVSLSLHEANAKGPKVPCWRLSPRAAHIAAENEAKAQEPTRPEESEGAADAAATAAPQISKLVLPTRCWALVPKTALQKGKSYVIVVRFGKHSPRSWSFRT